MSRRFFHLRPGDEFQHRLDKSCDYVHVLFVTAPPAPPDLSQRLALILQTLRNMIAAHAGRHRSAAPIVLLVWPYLHRVAARFDALAQKLRAGKLRAGGTAVATPRTRPAPRIRPPRLPGGFAWLIRLAPETAPLGSQLRHLLADPEFSALLAAAPQAGKILRPLCRMLGILPDPDLPPALFPPPAPRTVVPRTVVPRTVVPETNPPPQPDPEWPARPKPSPRYRPLARRYRFSPA